MVWWGFHFIGGLSGLRVPWRWEAPAQGHGHDGRCPWTVYRPNIGTMKSVLRKCGYIYHGLRQEWIHLLRQVRICNIPESKFNNRAKCLAISQVLRAKLYNNDLLFVYKKFFISCSIFFLVLSHIYIMYSPPFTYTSMPSLMLAWEPSSPLSPLFSPPHQQKHWLAWL